MKKVLFLLLGLSALLAAPVQAGHSLSDHGLFCTCSSPSDTAIYAGVRKVPGAKNFSYDLHITATNTSGGAGAIAINFRDLVAMEIPVPAGSSVNVTHALGGVPDVDDIVKITVSGGVISMMVSVLAASGAQDPFDETLEGAVADHSNFVVTAPSEPGSTSAAAIF